LSSSISIDTAIAGTIATILSMLMLF
jgi:hypothetical protein